MRAGRHDRTYGVKDVIHTVIYINCLQVRFGLFLRHKHMHVIAFHREDGADHLHISPFSIRNQTLATRAEEAVENIAKLNC